VRAVNDGGGEVFAARVPVVGRARVAAFFAKLARTRPPVAAAALRELNGAPALVVAYAHAPPRHPARAVTWCEATPDGVIVGLHTVVAPRKLTAVAW
jgi:RNA polymerase sigma-70 factor (ECF subfamily)